MSARLTSDNKVCNWGHWGCLFIGPDVFIWTIVKLLVVAMFLSYSTVIPLGTTRRSPKWLQFILRGTWLLVPTFRVIHPTVVDTFHVKPQCYRWCGSTGNFRGSPNLMGFILWAPWMSVEMFITINTVDAKKCIWICEQDEKSRELQQHQDSSSGNHECLCKVSRQSVQSVLRYFSQTLLRMYFIEAEIIMRLACLGIKDVKQHCRSKLFSSGLLYLKLETTEITVRGTS